MDKINFPINFNRIGLNYIMTHATFGYSDNISYLHNNCQQAVHDTIQMYGSELMRGGELHLQNGSQYYIERTLASGSYGTTAIIRNRSTNELYCIKCQNIRDEDDELDCFKEAMMHHILDFYTRPYESHKSDLIPTLYHVVRSNKVGGPIYFIMDLMSSSLSRRLSSFPSEHDRLFEFIRCLRHIIPTLSKLYKMGVYNHGDLHTGNVMYDEMTRSYKLIDYGFSRIQIGTGSNKHIFAITETNARSDESRDLSQLILAFEKEYHINDVEYTEGSFDHAVQQIIRSVVYDGYRFMDHSWKQSYLYFNTHTNPNGNHRTVQRVINALPEPSAVSASAVRRPHVSISSSVAPRTPRIGIAASAVVRTEDIRQINQQHQGCMLVLLIVILFTMRGALYLYYGRGGREPNMSYLSMSSQPTITYPNSSFQLKHLIKSNRKNSTTRTNRSFKKRNNTRRRSYMVHRAKIEDFDKLSLVSFYHFLRVRAFPGVSQKEKKEMLREAAMVPIQQPDIFSQIVDAVSRNQFDKMMEILEYNRMNLEKLGLEVGVYQEIWNTILDAYFEEKHHPVELLQTLLHVGDQVDDFLERYRSANQETKQMMVIQPCITASDYPEMLE